MSLLFVTLLIGAILTVATLMEGARLAGRTAKWDDTSLDRGLDLGDRG
jgi:hypothetical protein